MENSFWKHSETSSAAGSTPCLSDWHSCRDRITRFYHMNLIRKCPLKAFQWGFSQSFHLPLPNNASTMFLNKVNENVMHPSLFPSLFFVASLDKPTFLYHKPARAVPKLNMENIVQQDSLWVLHAVNEVIYSKGISVLRFLRWDFYCAPDRQYLCLCKKVPCRLKLQNLLQPASGSIFKLHNVLLDILWL